MTYEDLISPEDRKFWGELCKRDFRRLEKYQRRNLGEGHFLEESEPESEEVEQKPEPAKEERQADSLEGLLLQREREDEDFD